jgi:opacity protein-like surface antigen
MKRISLVAVALASAALAAGSAGAQVGSPPVQSGTRGFTLGLDLNGSAIERGTSAWPRGAGLGLSLGYGVSERVSLFTRANLAYRMAHVDVGARFTFGGTESRLRPYVEGAFTRSATSAFVSPTGEGPARSHGYGLTGGAGMEYFVSRRVAIDVGASYSRGEFTAGTFKGENFGSTRLNLGIKWRP